MPAPPPPDFDRLSMAELAALADRPGGPPVDRWNPEHCGHSRMKILKSGVWLHEGRPITRPEMVRLFSSILRRESDGRFVLVTPVEKLEIEVEDAPFVAVETRQQGEGRERLLAFRLNTGAVVTAGPDHPILFKEKPGGARPYLEVRRGLHALLARPVFYELAEAALAEGDDPPGLWSRGAFFPFVVA